MLIDNTTIRISYEDFVKIKNGRYNNSVLKVISSRYCGCKPYDIEDIDFNYKLTYKVFFNAAYVCRQWCEERIKEILIDNVISSEKDYEDLVKFRDYFLQNVHTEMAVFIDVFKDFVKDNPKSIIKKLLDECCEEYGYEK